MSWKKNKGGGYSTKKGGNVKNPKQYEKLRQQGKSKSQAAAITNSPGKKRKGKK